MEKHKKGGFTLIETVICIGIVTLLAIGAGTLLNSSSDLYRRSVFESDSTTLTGTLNTALSDLLRCADLSPAEPAGGGIYIGGGMGRNYAFSSSGLNYPVSRAHFALSADGVLQAVSDSGETYEVVNAGAYPNLKVSGFSCAYDGGSALKISYTVSGGKTASETRSVQNYTVRLLNGDLRDSATETAEKLAGDTGAYLAGCGISSPDNASLYGAWHAQGIAGNYIRDADLSAVLKNRDFIAIADACARKNGLTDPDRASVLRGLQTLPADNPYLAPYYCPASRETVVCFVSREDRRALCGTSDHASTCLLRYEHQWYFYYGNFDRSSKTVVPGDVLENFRSLSSAQISQMLNGDGWYAVP